MRFNIKEILVVAGIFMALNIGAGFASGQEIFQFFSSYGLWGFAGGLICFATLVFSCESIIDAGWVHRLCSKTSVFEYFCGVKIGNLYSILIPMALYGSFIIMMSGVGSVLEEFFRIPSWIGRGIVLALVIGSVFFDFRDMARFISRLGRIVAGIIIIICVVVIFQQSDGLFAGSTLVQTLDATSAGHSYYLAGVLYAGSITLASAQFLFEYGRTIHNRDDAFYGIVTGAFLYVFAAMIVHTAILIYVQEVYQLKIITLFFAEKISVMTAVLMALLIPTVMSSSSVSIFWSIGSVIRKKITMPQQHFYTLSIVLAVVGYFLAQIPFDKLINILYPINGVLGISFVVFIIIKNRSMARRIHS